MAYCPEKGMGIQGFLKTLVFRASFPLSHPPIARPPSLTPTVPNSGLPAATPRKTLRNPVRYPDPSRQSKARGCLTSAKEAHRGRLSDRMDTVGAGIYNTCSE